MINFSTNKASVISISNHLFKVDHKFVPKLSSYIDIESYSRKIFEKAERIELWKNDELMGLLAFYTNENRIFITNVSLDSSIQSLGYGKQLFKLFFEHIKNRKIKNIDLEVSSSNIKAINFYKTIGFFINKTSNNISFLNYIINE